MKEKYIIQKKLERSIYPYILSAAELKKTTDYTIYHWYNYTKEIISALAGAGIGTAIAKYMNEPGTALSASVPSWGLAGVLAFAVVGFLRNRAGREDVVQKILGQKKIMKQFRIISVNVSQAVLENDPKVILNKIIIIQQEAITLVNNAIQDGVWPFNGVNPNVIPNAKIEAEQLIKNSQPDWQDDSDDEASQEPDQY